MILLAIYIASTLNLPFLAELNPKNLGPMYFGVFVRFALQKNYDSLK